MMRKKNLSIKVLRTLLAMSCVYLGGTFSSEICAAAPAHETNTVTNTNKVYENGSTIIVDGTAVRASGLGKTTDITISDGRLYIEGSIYPAAVIAESKGNLIFRGNEIFVKNNGNLNGEGTGIAAFSGSSVNLKNQNTVINTNCTGVWTTGPGSNVVVDNDLKITIAGNNIGFGNHGILVSQGASVDAKGNTVIDVTGATDGKLTAGINIWNDPGLSNTASFNNVDIKVHGGDSSYGMIERGDTNKLTFVGDTVIEVKDAEFQNVGIVIDGDGTTAEFGNLNVTAVGGTSDVDGSRAGGIDIGGNSTVNFNGVTKIVVKDNLSNNDGLLVDNSTITMGKTEIEVVGGELAIGMQVCGSQAEITDDLNVNVATAGNESVGINIFSGSVFNAENVNVMLDGQNSSAFDVSNSNANLTGNLRINVNGSDGNRGMKISEGATFAGTTGDITVEGDDGTAILVIGDSALSFSDDVIIDAQMAIEVNGIDTNNGAKAQLQKGFISNHADSKLLANNGGIIDINTYGQGTVKFQGTAEVGHDQNNSDDGIINLNLNTEDSYWNMTGNSQVTDLKINNAIVDMRSDNNTYSSLKVNDFSGNGGTIKMDIDVRSMESDKIYVAHDFSGTQELDIYQKDGYVPAGNSLEGNKLLLAQVNGQGIFTAKDREGSLFYNHYELRDYVNMNFMEDGYSTNWLLDKIIKEDPIIKPTTSVDTVLSANALNYHTWRTENDKLLQRMGELRHNGEEAKGAWFRVKGSKIGRNGKFGFENKYTAYELGYDEVTKRTAEKTRYQGAALSYTDGSGSYSRGSGDNSSKAISFYNTEIGSKGHYLDLVFKISNMDNDFAVYDTNSNKITGDFNNTGVALSAEYGRKNELKNGWYVEPQAQFTLGYLGGDNYVTSNGIEVSQSGIKSAVGRIGFNIGKQIGSKGLVYAKANLLHEFGGGYDVTMTDSTGRVKVSDSFNDTWFEYGIGAAVATGKNSHIYLDVERSAGSDFTKDWQWNVGARWNF